MVKYDICEQIYHFVADRFDPLLRGEAIVAKGAMALLHHLGPSASSFVCPMIRYRGNRSRRIEGALSCDNYPVMCWFIITAQYNGPICFLFCGYGRVINKPSYD